MSISKVGDSPFQPQGGGAHTVQKGETMESIAKQYGFTRDALQSANPHIHQIQPGMSLVLPESGKTSQPLYFHSDILEKAADPGVFRSDPAPNFPGIHLSPGQFHRNDNGHLVISNSEVVDLFRSMLDRQASVLELNVQGQATAAKTPGDLQGLQVDKLSMDASSAMKQLLGSPDQPLEVNPQIAQAIGTHHSGPYSEGPLPQTQPTHGKSHGHGHGKGKEEPALAMATEDTFGGRPDLSASHAASLLPPLVMSESDSHPIKVTGEMFRILGDGNLEVLDPKLAQRLESADQIFYKP